MNKLFMVGFAPLSWRWGCVRTKPGVKSVYACGPFRFAIHNLGA